MSLVAFSLGWLKVCSSEFWDVTVFVKGQPMARHSLLFVLVCWDRELAVDCRQTHLDNGTDCLIDMITLNHSGHRSLR
jgi:hypothetical protein